MLALLLNLLFYNKSKFFILCFLVLATSSCEDIIQTDLEDSKLIVYFPPEIVTLQENSVQFWWDKLEGAEYYSLQIVEGTFNNVGRLIEDTITTKNKFSFIFEPGVYQWRIRAENNISSSSYCSGSLTIDSTWNLSLLSINITAPPQNFITSDSSVVFAWQSLTAALYYQFQLYDINSLDTILDTILVSTLLNHSLADGYYQYYVRGINLSSSTVFSNRSLTVDSKSPIASQLTAPMDGDTVSNPVVLNWIKDLDTEYDSLLIWTDTLQAPIINKILYSNMDTFTGPVSTWYILKLKSFDLAGNHSSSGFTQFYIPQ